MLSTNTSDVVTTKKPAEYDPFELNDIICHFAESIEREPDEPFYEFHFGALENRIEWDDQDFSHMEIWPDVTVSVNISEISSGRLNCLFPDQVARYLFDGPTGARIYDNLEKVLKLERERWADDPNSRLHIAEMEKIMRRVRKSFVRRVLKGMVINYPSSTRLPILGRSHIRHATTRR